MMVRLFVENGNGNHHQKSLLLMSVAEIAAAAAY